MSSYTPGPWKLEGVQDPYPGWVVTGTMRRSQRTERLTRKDNVPWLEEVERREIEVAWRFSGPPYDEVEANLQLISTAPDLLDLCEEVLSGRIDLERIREVVRRARGESPGVT